jgi:SET domain-containing protein
VRLRPGIVIAPWMDPRIEIRESPIHGRGMFARESFGSGEVALIWGGTVFSEADIKAGKANPQSITLVEEGIYLGDLASTANGADYCLNHCCDSNLWMRDAITLVTRDVIEEDEELTLDYALFETTPEWILSPCGCGSPLCRGKVTSQDWRLPALQERYRGHFAPVNEHWIESHGLPG